MNEHELLRIAMLALGALIVLFPYLRLLFARIRYMRVPAVCTEVRKTDNSHSDGGGFLYQPVWEYDYEERKYHSSVTYLSDTPSAKVGDKKHIYILPKEPTKIYVFSVGTAIFLTLFGLVWCVLAWCML